MGKHITIELDIDLVAYLYTNINRMYATFYYGIYEKVFHNQKLSQEITAQLVIAWERLGNPKTIRQSDIVEGDIQIAESFFCYCEENLENGKNRHVRTGAATGVVYLLCAARIWQKEKDSRCHPLALILQETDFYRTEKKKAEKQLALTPQINRHVEVVSHIDLTIDPSEKKRQMHADALSRVEEEAANLNMTIIQYYEWLQG